ncbi:thioredoxin TrxA [Paenalcaligenes faecalis]|uniref:thioredoxin TrxA n=1 Tax=Paenalcaligenes faecalis TaxID=2980099 RepID=UPI0022B94F98|nr:thioredoxin TrxA [Paenalcaligenes faecalis]
MSQNIKNVSDASFSEDVLQSGQPVLVDYWAAWCGPCKAIAPILDEVAEQYAGRVTIAKLNVDENPETAAKFGIRGIPTLMLFKDGQPTETKVGALSKSQLQELLDNSL